MNKSESKFFQTFKERTGKDASKLAAKPRERKPKSPADPQSGSEQEKGPRTKVGKIAARKLKVQKDVNAQLRGSLETLKGNYLDLREKYEQESRYLKRQLFEEREKNKQLRNELKSLVRGKAK
jgi:hypothetical protein